MGLDFLSVNGRTKEVDTWVFKAQAASESMDSLHTEPGRSRQAAWYIWKLHCMLESGKEHRKQSRAGDGSQLNRRSVS